MTEKAKADIVEVSSLAEMLMLPEGTMVRVAPIIVERPEAYEIEWSAGLTTDWKSHD